MLFYLIICFISRPPPTFWEAAADAILLRKTVKSMDFRDPDHERSFFNQPELHDANTEQVINSEVMINQFLIKDNDDK